MSDRSKPTILVVVRQTKPRFRVDLSDRIISFEFEDNEKKADKLKITVDNWDLANFDNPVWRKGNIIEVSWGYPKNMAPPRNMVIKKVKGFQQLNIEARGTETLMGDTTRRRTFNNKSIFDIVGQLAEEAGFGPALQFIQATTASKQIIEAVTQAAMTNLQMVRWLGSRLGFEFFHDFDGFHFHRRDMGADPIKEFTYFTSEKGEILALDVDNDVTGRPAQVRLCSIDPRTKERVEEIASNQESPDRGSTSLLSELWEGLGNVRGTDGVRSYSAVINTSQLEETIESGSLLVQLGKGVGLLGRLPAIAISNAVDALPGLLKARADRRFRKGAETQVKLSMRIVGDASMVGKSVFLLKGVGKRLSGKYYAKVVTHRIDSGSGYTTDIKAIASGHGGYRPGFDNFPDQEDEGQRGRAFPDKFKRGYLPVLNASKLLGGLLYVDTKGRPPPKGTDRT